MGNVMFYNDKVLFNPHGEGEEAFWNVAMNPDCCCGNCCGRGCDEYPSALSLTFYGMSSAAPSIDAACDCDTHNGVEYEIESTLGCTYHKARGCPYSTYYECRWWAWMGGMYVYVNADISASITNSGGISKVHIQFSLKWGQYTASCGEYFCFGGEKESADNAGCGICEDFPVTVENDYPAGGYCIVDLVD